MQETKLVFLEDSLSVLEFYKRTRKLEKRIEKLEDKIDIQKKSTKPYVARCGPVCSSLETVLKAQKIPIHYHGRSFTGNHSQKYITPSTNRVICSSILSQTIENTNNQKIIDYAVHVQNTFHQANILFFNIHRAISHSRPIDTHEIKPIQDMIDKYLTFYRDNASQKIFPKLHFLEHRSTEWITRYSFGMGLHGDQGLELEHSSIKKLANQSQGMRREEDKLRVLMKSHLSQVSPMLLSLIPSPVKRKGKK